MSFVKDYSFGKKKEEEVYKILELKFKDNIKVSENKFERFDFKGDKYLYELKSRNNKYNDYPTTLIEKGKAREGIIFLFNFQDGLYYIRYSDKKFSKFECKEFCRNRRCDFNDVPKLYYYIPIEKLKKIDVNRYLHQDILRY